MAGKIKPSMFSMMPESFVHTSLDRTTDLLDGKCIDGAGSLDSGLSHLGSTLSVELMLIATSAPTVLITLLRVCS